MVREASIWDFGRWEWWGIILELIPLEFHKIWSHKGSFSWVFIVFHGFFKELDFKELDFKKLDFKKLYFMKLDFKKLGT